MNQTTQTPKNKSILISLPNTDQVVLVIGVVLDPATLDVESLLAALVPEMAKGEVRGGLLVLGDATLILRFTGEEVLVDEVSTVELLSLADIEEPLSRANLVELMIRWIDGLRGTWRDRLVGRLKPLLVPHIVAGLMGDLDVTDGIWGSEARRVASQLEKLN